MKPYQRQYVSLLNTALLTTVTCVSIVVVMSDHGEEREPWEFVPSEIQHNR